jgi:hypothetical protein
MGNSASISPMNQRKAQYSFFPTPSPSLQSYLKDQLLEDFAEKQKTINGEELTTSVRTDESDYDSDDSAILVNSPIKQKKEPAGFRTPVRERVRRDSISAVIRYWNEPDGEASPFRHHFVGSGSFKLAKAAETAVATTLGGKSEGVAGAPDGYSSSFSSSASTVSLSDRMENIEFCQLLRKILISFSSDSPIETDFVNDLLFRLDCMEELTSDEAELRDELLLDIKNDVNTILLTPMISCL